MWVTGDVGVRHRVDYIRQSSSKTLPVRIKCHSPLSHQLLQTAATQRLFCCLVDSNRASDCCLQSQREQWQEVHLSHEIQCEVTVSCTVIYSCLSCLLSMLKWIVQHQESPSWKHSQDSTRLLVDQSWAFDTKHLKPVKAGHVLSCSLSANSLFNLPLSF